MTEVVVSSAAERDYTEALCWYAERSSQAAERFDLEFDLAMQAIASNHLRFPKCDQRHRYYLMRHFPFQVVFREHDHKLVIIAVAHTSREPRFWDTR